MLGDKMKKDVYELTNPQKNIWNTEMFFQGTNINNVCGSSLIKEKIDFDLLKQAFTLFVKQNDCFQIRIFLDEDNNPMQYFADFESFSIDVVDVSSLDELYDLEQELAKKKFDLLNHRLFDVKLARFPNGYGAVVLNVHHIISDSWSSGLTIQEIVKNYHALKEHSTYVPTTSSYKEYILSEQQYKKSKKFENDKSFWGDYLANLPEIITLPSWDKTQKGISSKGERKAFFMDSILMKEIDVFCQEHKISLYTFFMSIISIFIGLSTNTFDFILGMPILNRTNFKEKHSLGMFVTTVPFRISFDASTNFIDFANKVGINLISVLRHQKYSYTNIIEDLRKENHNIPNLYNISVSYQITKALEKEVGDYDTHWAFNHHSLNDINIHMSDLNDTGNIELEYDFVSNKYTEEEINFLHNAILHIMNQVLNYPSTQLSDIELLPKKQKEQILNEFNNRTLDVPMNTNIIELFENQVEMNPNQIALVYKDKSFTYSELNKRVNQLARFLQSKGISQNDIVGVFMNKTDWFILSILAIQKLGAAYLPMHPDYPEERVNYILSDSKAKLVITDQTLSLNTPMLSPEKMKFDFYDDTNLSISFNNDTLCYVIYTSGSTGKPKGVMLTHANLINFIYNFNDCFKYNFSTKDACLSLTNVSFDVSVCEIYTPLCFGATLVLYPKNTLTDIRVLMEVLEREHVTFLYLPPNVLDDVYRFIINTHKKFEISKMLVGVEAIKNGTLNRFIELNPQIEIVNGYGPTETTICCTFYPYHLNDKETNIVPIGYPLKNNNIYILNSFNQLLPIGYPGEICVTGQNVSSGYLAHPELTKKSFVKISNLSDKPIYKTGDIGYFTKDGYLEFMGRKDSQIKFKGYRIELDEINKAILNVSGISNSVTLIKEVGEIPSICTYFTTTNSTLTPNLVREQISNLLPYYMMPSHLIALNEFPITPNGKIDRKNLPEILPSSNATDLPLTKTQEQLCIIITKLTGMQVSVQDNFFDIGIDSLTAIRLSLEVYYTFHKNISIKDVFQYNSIKKLSEFLDASEETNRCFQIEKAEKSDYYDLSYSQKAIYYACQIADKNSLVYNVSGGFLVDDILDSKKIENAFYKIVKKHSAFRTYFVLVDNEPKQVVLDEVPFYVNFSEEKIEDSQIQTTINNFPKPFNLEQSPLLRVKVVYVSSGKTLLLIDSHHIVLDGSSLHILMKDFCTFYQGQSSETTKIDYVDYVQWEHQFITSDTCQELEKYWLDKLSSKELPVLNLPYDKKAKNESSFCGTTKEFSLPDNLITTINEVAKKYEVSPYMLHLATFYLLLYQYTSQEEIIIGTPLANRFSEDLNNVIGMFVNNLILKVTIDSNLSFTDFLSNLKNQVLEDMENQPYPYNLLLEKLQIKNPFDVMFVYQDIDNEHFLIDGKTTCLIPSVVDISKFNLSFQVIPQQNKVYIEYRTDLFEGTTIERFFEHYRNLLQNIITHFDKKISTISMISEDEKNKILYHFNNTKVDYYPLSSKMIDIIEANVSRFPSKSSLVFEGQTLTYLQLNEKANKLASYLISCGVKSKDIVSILLPRGFDLIISILAVLKVDATYLLIDNHFPESRIMYLLENSKSAHLITYKELYKEKNLDFSSVIEPIYKSSIIDIKAEKENPNFSVIYTSGSTGNPKGVILKQSSMINVIYDFAENMQLKNCENILGMATVSFDMFAVELFSSLMLGKTLYLANFEEQRDIIQLGKLIKENHIDFFVTTPSRVDLLISDSLTENYLESVKVFQLGGEVFTQNLYNRLRKVTKAAIYNGYGPTETTACASNKLITSGEDITIGTPVSNCQIYICDSHMNLSPIGVEGEICIAGRGVSSGYLYNEKVTAQKFIPNPFGSGFLYKTGDLGKYNENGEITYIGRNDFQVKIHGLRIELSEIENKIYNLPGIIKCSVLYKNEPNISYLVAFYTCKYDISPQYIRDILYDTLPQYMVPNYIIKLEDFPVTPNGKIDRNALLSYPIDINKSSAYVEPENDFQRLCCDIWSKLLNTKVGIDDNFFDLGADSLLAIRFKTELLAHNINIDYSDLFKYKTVRTLSKLNKINTSSTLDAYDYSKIDALLKNSYQNLQTISSTTNHILLLGSTGFIGMHILEAFLKQDTGKIYCIVREKDNYESAKTRFIDILHFYFDTSLDKYMDDRIIVLTGDITQEYFGLSLPIYNSLGEKVSTVINAAANVKHYGDFNKFKNINIDALDYMIQFCLTFDKRLLHLSSLSVSGNTLLDGSITDSNPIKKNFTEKDLYIKQQLDNVYTRSKFDAEKLILDNIINNHLQAQILRLGNITSRYSDGKFQMNCQDNAFANKLKSFINLGAVPDYLLNEYLEFTPVDLCSEAIIDILKNNCKNVYIYHIYNHHHVYIKTFVEMLGKLGINLRILGEEEFKTLINKILEEDGNTLFGIINDFNPDKKLSYVQNSSVKSKLSQNLLLEFGFEWKEIDFEYMKKYITYLQNINFI